MKRTMEYITCGKPGYRTWLYWKGWTVNGEPILSTTRGRRVGHAYGRKIITALTKRGYWACFSDH